MRMIIWVCEFDFPQPQEQSEQTFGDRLLHKLALELVTGLLNGAISLNHVRILISYH